MMACAIFNPFCCCTAGVLSSGDMDTAHSCCQSQFAGVPAEGDASQEHDMAECPHAALKDYEVTHLKNVTAAHDNGTLLPALLIVFDWLAVEATISTKLSLRETTISQAPPRSFAQVYCVYRV
jgi:hypothetical protein